MQGVWQMFISADLRSVRLSGDFTCIDKLWLSGEEISGESAPLFAVRLRDAKGVPSVFSAVDAVSKAESCENGVKILYGFDRLTVKVMLFGGDALRWSLEIENDSELAVEYVDFPSLSVAGKLRRNGGDAAVVSPYNEGLIVEDSRLKPEMTDPEYPSLGNYMMFPYMVFAQFMLYLKGDHGIYMGIHDDGRAPKGIDFRCTGEGTDFRVRMFMGGGYGESVKAPEIVWKGFSGNWMDGAELYRAWLGKSFKAVPMADLDLPDWYKNDMPLVLTYPVRGIHDMDEMQPNKLFPYENVLPLVEEFEKKTNSRIMVLLMHWEGTAPWAPPVV